MRPQAAPSLSRAPPLHASAPARPSAPPGVSLGGYSTAVEAAVVYDWEKSDFYARDAAIVDTSPQKPNPRTLLRSVGSRPKNPRDRFIHTEGLVAKDYLPPPIYPGRHGHGVVTSYLSDQNHYIRDEAKLRGRPLEASSASLSPLRKPGSREPSFIEGDSVEEGSLNEANESGRGRRQLVIDYPKHFPTGKPSTITSTNLKLLREAASHH